MFDKYGEFDSVEELNAKAMELLLSSNTDSVTELALENGLDEDDTIDFICGYEEELATVQLAAVGKLQVEHKDLKPDEIMEDWYDYITKLAMEDEVFARAVRRKGKSLIGCIGQLLKWSYTNMYNVDKRICSAAGVNASVKMGIPGTMRARVIIREYYLEV